MWKRPKFFKIASRETITISMVPTVELKKTSKQIDRHPHKSIPQDDEFSEISQEEEETFTCMYMINGYKECRE